MGRAAARCAGARGGQQEGLHHQPHPVVGLPHRGAPPPPPPPLLLSLLALALQACFALHSHVDPPHRLRRSRARGCTQDARESCAPAERQAGPLASTPIPRIPTLLDDDDLLCCATKAAARAGADQDRGSARGAGAHAGGRPGGQGAHLLAVHVNARPGRLPAQPGAAPQPTLTAALARGARSGLPGGCGPACLPPVSCCPPAQSSKRLSLWELGHAAEAVLAPPCFYPIGLGELGHAAEAVLTMPWSKSQCPFAACRGAATAAVALESACG